MRAAQRIITILAGGVAAGVIGAGCSTAPLAENLGSVAYVRDRQPATTPVTYLHPDGRAAAVADQVRALGATGVAGRVDAVDGSTHVVVTLYFDACAKQEPELVLRGSVLSVRYGVKLNRNCLRAVDTLTVFSVPRSSLPDPTVLEACGQRVTLSGNSVTGDPIGLC